MRCWHRRADDTLHAGLHRVSGPRLSPPTGTVAWVGFSDARQRRRTRFCAGPDARDEPVAQNSLEACAGCSSRRRTSCDLHTAKNAARGSLVPQPPHNATTAGWAGVSNHRSNGKRVNAAWPGTRSDNGARCTRVRCYNHRNMLVDLRSCCVTPRLCLRHHSDRRSSRSRFGPTHLHWPMRGGCAPAVGTHRARRFSSTGVGARER